MMNYETLESRLVFSSSLSAGVLTVTGRDVADKVLIYKGSNTTIIVEENDVKKTYTTSAVKRINVDAKGGNDRVEVSKSLTIETSLRGGSGQDTVVGGGGKDSIYGDAGNDNLSDSAGGATIRGGDNSDTLRGGAGVDALFGDAGDDNLEGGTGKDYLDGGSGYDTVDYSARTTRVSGGINYVVVNQKGSTRLVAGDTARLKTTGYGGSADTDEGDNYADVEALSGSSANDSLGTAPEDVEQTLVSGVLGLDRLPTLRLDGNGGNDSLSIDQSGGVAYRVATEAFGHAGEDRISGGGLFPQLSIFHGGSGDDRAFAGNNTGFTFFGDDGDDNASIYSEDKTGRIAYVPGAGVDVFVTNYFDGDYTMVDGLENLYVDDSVETKIFGNALDNQVVVNGRVAYLDTGLGNDTVLDANGSGLAVEPSGTLITSEGNDTVDASFQNIDTGAGDDTVNLVLLSVRDADDNEITANFAVQLGSGNDEFMAVVGDNIGDYDLIKLVARGGTGSDDMTGSNLSDTLYGDAGDDALVADIRDQGIGTNFRGDVLNGGGGSDTLLGGEGPDALFGGENDDLLIGGDGKDKLYGFGGNDTLYNSGGPQGAVGDGSADLLDGGSGTDKGRRESGVDSVLSIESFI